MTKNDIKKSKIYPVLILESIASEANLRKLTKFLETLFLLFVIVTLGGSLVIDQLNISNAAFWTHWFELKLLGVLSLNFAVMIFVFMLVSYLRSSYYFENVIGNDYKKKDLYTFTVGRILYRSKNDDWLAGFLTSDTGLLIMERAGILKVDIETFLKDRPVAQSNISLSEEKVLILRDFVSTLYKENADFTQFLYKYGIGDQDLHNIVDWVVDGIESREMTVRFWRKENLDRLGSLGRTWSYGITPKLDVYCEDLLDRAEAQYSAYEFPFHDKEVRQMENVLARLGESNVLLVGENEPARMDVLWSLIKEIKRGKILSNLEHKRVLLFDTGLFLSGFKTRSEFEQEFIRVMDEAVKAGDVILIFDDFPNLLTGALGLESQIFGLLDKYISSARIQLIAMADTDKFHQTLESRSEVMARFERVIVTDLPPEEAVMTLIENVDQIERQTKLRFSYQALKEIVRGADSYMSQGALTDRAKDLISELIPWLCRFPETLVTAAKVSQYLSEKTNIPTGEITAEEKNILLKLEEVLHSRVIGQNPAITAVANAMKRARAGVQNQKRPLGSFMFLGPTGVGKTETAKALSFAYFGTEDKMMRLDMTEYQDEDALARLIGSFKDNKPGVLSNLIRQNVFGVLLLDEFEKTNKDVHNLFLQILDEGFFSDMNGKRVNTRNIIFIATSNAGAGTIWKMVKEGKDPSEAKDDLIDEIVNAGIYKPELLNRFDDVIVFHPLKTDELRQIAGLMLKKLAKRLEPKGIKLKINDYLPDLVSREGANEVFGARPMNRYIQDKIEQAIADKIISGELKPGMSVEFNASSEGNLSLTLAGT